MQMRTAGIWMSAILTSGSASAQIPTSTIPQRFTPPRWEAMGPPFWTPGDGAIRPLDPGLEDIGPTGSSLRQTQFDPRQPLGFEQVYAAPGGLLMRQQGALRAEFPRSMYNMTDSGLTPEIPAGTVFHIGPDTLITPRSSRPGVDLRVRRRVERRIGSPGEDRAAPQLRRSADGRGSGSILSSESYRRQRVGELLSRARRGG